MSDEPHPLDIPEELLVKNRRPLTPERRARIDAMFAVTKQNDLRKQQAQTKQEREKRRRWAREDRKKAIASGAAAAMPLEGKAALKFLRRST